MTLVWISRIAASGRNNALDWRLLTRKCVHMHTVCIWSIPLTTLNVGHRYILLKSKWWLQGDFEDCSRRCINPEVLDAAQSSGLHFSVYNLMQLECYFHCLIWLPSMVTLQRCYLCAAICLIPAILNYSNYSSYALESQTKWYIAHFYKVIYGRMRIPIINSLWLWI